MRIHATLFPAVNVMFASAIEHIDQKQGQTEKIVLNFEPKYKSGNKNIRPKICFAFNIADLPFFFFFF